ncbi:MAG: RagB/SusD family nutrient uptake outer membrane protein [Bacteroidota bacterium]
MKKIVIASLTLILLATVSCKDSFLDVPVQGGVTIDSDPNLASSLVVGVYASLLQGDSWGNGDIHGFAFISVTNIISDDADKGSTAGDQLVPVGDIDDFNTTSTNKFAETLWGGHYNGIGTANQALKALNSSTVLTADVKNEYIAEVRFIRGYLYFNLVRMFGKVPLVLNVAADAEDAATNPVFTKRAAVADVYAAIESDLQFAADNLPLKSAASQGHVTKGAAQAMLAKVYMYQQDWQKVFDLTNDVIASNQYSLITDYASLWRQSQDFGAESIFEIGTGKFNNANLKIDNYTVCQGPRTGGAGGWDDLGWGFNDPSQSLVNSYEPGDLRRDATIIFVNNSGDHKGTTFWDGYRLPSADSVQNLRYNYKAYTSKTKEQFAIATDKDRPKNVRILRYAEVLLMNAEAGVHLGQGDPDGKINLLRDRADLDPITGVTIDDVWKERRVELAMENDRFWDLVRQGRAAEVMQASGKNFIQGKHELLPVPNSQILLSNGLLDQNPGY